jgi:CRP-like cAMP-binding protein
VKEIIMVLKDTVYLPGDFICRPGDDGNAMFFIVSGSVSILVSKNYAAARGYAGMQDQRANQDGVGQSVIFDDSFSAVAVNHAGAYFGEISVLTGEKRKAYVRADIFVTLATLYKNDFHTIIKKYPEQLGVLLSHMNMAMLAESAKKQRNKNMGAISGRDHDADEYGSDDGSDTLLLSEQHVSDDGQQQNHRRQSRSRTIACTGAMRRSSFSSRGADVNSQEPPPGYSGQRRWSRTRSFSSANLDVLQGGGSGGVSPSRPVPSSRRSSITNIASYRRSSSMSNLEIAKAVAQDELQYGFKKSTKTEPG